MRCTLLHPCVSVENNYNKHWLILRNQHRGVSYLTSLPLCKIATILQTTFSNAFPWITSFVFFFEFYWSLFLRIQLTIRLHCTGNVLATTRRQAITWTNADPAACVIHICGTRRRRVKSCRCIRLSRGKSGVIPIVDVISRKTRTSNSGTLCGYGIPDVRIVEVSNMKGSWNKNN